MSARRAALLVEGDHEEMLLRAVLLAAGWDGVGGKGRAPQGLASWTSCTWVARGPDEVLVQTVRGNQGFQARPTRDRIREVVESGVQGGLGFVVDADVYGSVAGAVDSVRSQARVGGGCVVPDGLGAGEIGSAAFGPPGAAALRIGVWVSPDNATASGSLDDLLCAALRVASPELDAAAREFVDRAGVRQPTPDDVRDRGRLPRSDGAARVKLRAHVTLAPFNPGASLATALGADGERALKPALGVFAPLLGFMEGLLGPSA